MIHGKITCPKCSTHFEISLTAAPEEQATASRPAFRQAEGPSAGASEISELLDMINDDELDGKNAEFVASVRDRYEQYGSRTFASEKQMAWLKRLAGV